MDAFSFIGLKIGDKVIHKGTREWGTIKSFAYRERNSGVVFQKDDVKNANGVYVTIRNYDEIVRFWNRSDIER